MREFCTLASESRAQTGTLDASNIYYGLPEYFRPGQQDASELFEYFMRTCPLFQTFFTGIETQTQDYSHCRPCNTQSLPFTTRVLHVKDTKHTTGAVSLKQLILDYAYSATLYIPMHNLALRILKLNILNTTCEIHARPSAARNLVLSLVRCLPCSHVLLLVFTLLTARTANCSALFG